MTDKIRIGQIGIGHDHGEAKMRSFGKSRSHLKWSDMPKRMRDGSKSEGTCGATQDRRVFPLIRSSRAWARS